MCLESLIAIWKSLIVANFPMDYDRSKRLEKILESANQFEEEERRRRRVSSILWSLLVALILIGMFFAGRAWYSRGAASKELRSESTPIQSASTHAAAVTSPDSDAVTRP